ncbi:MAG: hypothetical protein PHS68_06740, partial [Candidatus Izemoplasmatales bacterium]|nr:hypothetical protein [Candidatus Izemoplasmatales bacterium]
AQRDSGYWDAPEEMLARAFTTYIHDKTNKNNDYLSAHAEAAITLDADKDGEPVIVKAFPEGEERVKINKAFDVLFDTMKQDGFFTEFTGVRPLQIVSYKSNNKGDSGQTLFAQEPMAERKEPQIKEIIKEKEETETPLTATTEFHTKPTQVKLFGEGETVQLSLFDDNTRFSILAADDKTVYNEREVKKAMTEALAERLFMGNEKSGILDKMNERELMQMFADKIKNSKNKEKTADDLAEFVIQRAVIEETFEDDPNFIDDRGIKDYKIMKGYLHQFDLDSIRKDIQYTFDKDKSVFAMWGKRTGTQGLTPDVIAQELRESGILIDAINPAEIFEEFVRKYKDLSDRVHKRNQIVRRSLKSINGFALDIIKNDLKKDFMSIIENEGRPAVPKDIAKVKNAEIKELDAKIKAMAEDIARLENEAGEQTEKSAEMREELWVMNHNYDRVNLELKEDKDFINSMVAIHKLAKEDIRRISNKLADTQKRHRAEMALFERIDRVKNLTTYVGAGVQLADEVIGLIKLLKKQKTWRGKLTADIRNIMRTYSRKTDGLALYDLLSQDENPYADEIQAIANGQGELTTAEIITLKDVLDKFVHDVREYDRVYWQGEKAHATEVGANLIKETGKTIPFKEGWLADEWRKIDNALEAPYWRFMRLSNYDDNGIMAKMFWELKDALNKRDGFSMKVVKHFEEFYKKNQKLVDSWRDTVDLNGVKISKGQAMALYLSSFREQMQNHLYNQTENIVTDKEIHVIRKGAIKIADEKKALKSMREAFENATEQKITEEWVQGLLSQFNAEEREYMRLVHDFFNVISAEAKTETDFALHGIRGDLEKHYFPIRVASDQIFKKIGDKMFMDLFTVYKPSFTKKVVKNANNMVVIENITDVVNRHARQMADYYGFAVVMKTFTRIWNAKTENGTARQAVQKVDPLFEKYVDKLFKDMQHNVPEREGFDKLVSKLMGWGATAALAANPKVWVNQMVALFAGHGIGIKYSSLMKGLKNALKQKGDYTTMMENSPFLYARFNDGFNVASGALLEKKGLFGKASKLTELTLQPIEYMDKLMIAGVWNAAMLDSNNDVKKAAEITERAVIITQQNFTPLFRPEILRTNSSLLRLSTMFMSEPLQMFSQLFGAIDRRRVAKELKKRAVTPEEHANADRLLVEANKNMKFAFTSITVDLVLLTLIAQAFMWIKGKDDEEEFAVGFGKELLANFIGMFPFLRDAYSIIEGYDVTNMAYTGLTNITNAGKEIFTTVSDAVQGKYQSGQEISAGIRKTIIGLSQTFGIPIRNIESYVKGIVEKVSPSAGETYESWFWKKSDAEYQKVLDEALEKGNDRLADTVIDLILKKRLTVDNDTVTKELKRLYKTGQQVAPPIVQPMITHNGESIELSARDYKQFVGVYSQANKEAETLIRSPAYRVLSDTVKADAVKLVYDYFYNLAKSELVGESTARYIDLTGIPTYKLAIILAQTKNLTADKDEQGKSISGSKKYKVERALVGLYLTQAQKNKVMEYLGYSI